MFSGFVLIQCQSFPLTSVFLWCFMNMAHGILKYYLKYVGKDISYNLFKIYVEKPDNFILDLYGKILV